MKSFSKKCCAVLITIIFCICLIPTLFANDCKSVFDSENERFLYDENDIRYYCDNKTKTAFVKKIFLYHENKETGEGYYNFDDTLETVVIPEKIKNGEYTVAGLYSRVYTIWGMSSLAPSSWKNIKKIYLPYTSACMEHERTFDAGGLSYGNRMTVLNPHIGAYSGNPFRETGRTIFTALKYVSYESYGYILATVPQKHYDMVVEQYGTLETPPTETVEEYVQNLVTPNYVFNFNYEGAPNEGIYWIDLIEDENTVFVLPTNPTREGYTFGGWYTEEDCITEWDGEMTPTAKVKNMYAKWVPAETEEPVETAE